MEALARTARGAAAFFGGLALAAAPGCPAPPDDDSAAAGDDDDSSPDPDLPADGVVFSLVLTVLPPAGAGARGGEPAEPSTVHAALVVEYFRDLDAGDLLCRQRLEADGTGFYGVDVMGADCTGCTGFLALDPASAADVSDPAGFEADCDPAELESWHLDYGAALLSPRPDGFGDALEIALVDETSFDAAGLAMDLEGDWNSGAIQEQLGSAGLVFTHAGYVRADDASLAVQSGLDELAAPAPGGEDWLAYWQVFRNPGTNPHEGPDQDGDYGTRAAWALRLPEPGDAR